uniref:Uncharacterized protein n=1 Tax=Oryza glaberrima TaxID=4538 RepID=I1PI80_ORYGL
MTGVDLSPRRGWRACSSGWMLRVEQVAAHIEELMREGGDAVARGPVERLVRRATEPNRHLRLHRCLPVPSHAAAPPSLFPVAVATADNLRVNPVSYAVELVSAAKGKVNMEYMRLVVDLMVKRDRLKSLHGKWNTYFHSFASTDQCSQGVILFTDGQVPTYRRFSPLPTYRHLSSHSPAPAHRVGKPRRAEVEELLGRHGDELPGGTGRCLSVNPLTTPPPLEIRHWGDGRRRRDPRAVVAGNGCGHRRADGREARSWRAAVAVVDGLMGGRSATAAVARSWWAPDDSHAWRHGSLFL